MGQQQLLLLVITSVIVGIALVIGIEVFGSSMAKSNEDSIRHDIIEISSRLQEYYRKPSILGGGGHNFPVSLNFDDLSYQGDNQTGNTFENSNGTFTLSVESNVVTITGEGNETGVSLTYTLTAQTTLKKLTLAEIVS
jgi:hypothetical protein